MRVEGAIAEMELKERDPGNRPAAKDAADVQDTGQAYRAFDDSGQRFREGRPQAEFSGASGVLFEQAMAQTRMAICLTDPNQDDDPIVFANRAFRELTGYDESEILGRNCRFLQGPDTDEDAVQRLRDALKRETVVVVEILNYRKDGTPFWNALHLGPIYNAEGRLMYFFGSQWDVTDVRSARAEEHHARVLTRELSHRMKNMFAVIAGIVTVTGRTRGIEREAQEINERIHALGRAYETTLDDARSGSVEVGGAVRSVLAPYDPEGDRISVSGGRLRVDPAAISTIGLTLHELATNAVRHGALSRPGGRATIEIGQGGEGEVVIQWNESGGPAPGTPEPGSGLEIVDSLLAAAGGGLNRRWGSDGLSATVRLPQDAPE